MTFGVQERERRVTLDEAITEARQMLDERIAAAFEENYEIMLRSKGATPDELARELDHQRNDLVAARDQHLETISREMRGLPPRAALNSNPARFFAISLPGGQTPGRARTPRPATVLASRAPRTGLRPRKAHRFRGPRPLLAHGQLEISP